MAKKQFKIGEYAIGGIISVEITGSVIKIEALDWNTKQPLTRENIVLGDPNAYRNIDNCLNDLTSCYHADKIIEWIESKINLQ